MKNSIRSIHHAGVALALGLASPAIAQTSPTPTDAPQIIANDWVSLSHSGLRFAVPVGFEITEDDPQDHLLSLSGDIDGAPLRIVAQYHPPSQLAAMAARLGAYPMASEAFFSAYAGTEVVQMDGAELPAHIGPINELPVVLLRSSPEAASQISVIIAHYPNGAQAWFGLMGEGHAAEDFATYEASLWHSLSIDPAAAPADGAEAGPISQALEAEASDSNAPPPPIDLLGDIVLLMPAEGEFLTQLSGDARRGVAAFGRSEWPPSDLMFAAMAMPDDPERLVSAMSDALTTVSAYQETTLNGLPVLQMDGFAAMTPDGDGVEPSNLHPARFYLTHACLPEAGPLALGLLLTPERMDALDGDLSARTAQLTVNMPDGNAQCGPEFGMALQAWLNTAQETADGSAEGEHIPLMGQVFTIPATPGDVVMDQRDRQSRTITPIGPQDGSPNRVFIARQFDEIEGRFERNLTAAFTQTDDIREAMIGETPVWIVEGAVNRGVDQERLEGDQTNPARIYVAQSCVNGVEPVTLALLADREFADSVGGLDSVAEGLQLTLPDTATPCPAALAEFMGELQARNGIAPQATADAESSTEPDPAAAIWVGHERFGLAFQAPQDMRVTRDFDDEVVLALGSEQDPRHATITAWVSGGENLGPTPGTPEFLVQLSEFGDGEMRMTDELYPLGDMVLRAYRNQGSEPEPGQPQVLYLIPDAPSAAGLSPWFIVATFGHSAEETAEMQTRFISSLRVTDAELYAPPPVAQVAEAAPSLTLIEDLVQIAPLEPYVITDERVRSDRGRMGLAAAEGETAHTLYAAQAYAEPNARVAHSLTEALPEIDTISQGTLGDIPVWIFEGTVDFSPAREPLTDGSVSHGRFVLTQTCGPDGAGPLGIGVLTTDAHLAQMGGFDALFAGVNVVMPADAAPCPAEFIEMIDAIGTPPEPATAPQEPAPAPQAPTAKPSAFAAPDDADWERAHAEYSIPALLDFIRDWPNGRNADAAREALALLGIQAPANVPSAAADDPDGVAWLEAQSLATPEAFWTYLKAQPNGAMRLVAQDWLEMLLIVQRGDYYIEPAPAPPTKHG